MLEISVISDHLYNIIQMGEVEVLLEHALALQKQADITNTNTDDYTLLSKTIIPHPATKI